MADRISGGKIYRILEPVTNGKDWHWKIYKFLELEIFTYKRDDFFSDFIRFYTLLYLQCKWFFVRISWGVLKPEVFRTKWKLFKSFKSKYYQRRDWEIDGKDILQFSIRPQGAAQPHNQDFHWSEVWHRFWTTVKCCIPSCTNDMHILISYRCTAYLTVY